MKRLSPVFLLVYLFSCSWVYAEIDSLGLYADQFLLREQVQNKINPQFIQDVKARWNSRITIGKKWNLPINSISKLAGPDGQTMSQFVHKLDTIGHHKLKKFLAAFLNDLYSGKIVNKDVYDNNGQKLKLRLLPPPKMSWDKLSSNNLVTLYGHFLKATDDRPFAFLTNDFKDDLLKANYPGLKISKVKKYLGNYNRWVLNNGTLSELFKSNGVKASASLSQINQLKFNDISEYFITLNTLFESFDSNLEMEYPQNISLSGLKNYNLYSTIYLWHLSLYNNDLETLNIFDLLDGPYIKGDFSNNNLVLETSMFRNLKSNLIQKNKELLFLHENLNARLYAERWTDLENLEKWDAIPSIIVSLIKNNGDIGQLRSYLVQKYAVSTDAIEKYLDNVKKYQNSKMVFLLPFINWEEAPFLSQEKKNFIHLLTKDFLNFWISKQKINAVALENALKDWARALKLDDDFEEILRVKKDVSNLVNPQDFIPSKDVSFDVNQNFDIGIEYSGRFPIKPVYSTEKSVWASTRIGMSHKEKSAIIHNVTQSLYQHLGGHGDGNIIHEDDESSHGHGLSITYFMTDPLNRDWRVEWDGIVRNYNSDGGVAKDSARAGHIELVTPRFTPRFEDMLAVEKAFKDHNVIPSYFAGGGHINVDLAPFDDYPAEFARFLSYFHKYRSIIALMFQYEGRMSSAMPFELTDDLNTALQNFNGSTEELKTLLYNEHYFNQRVGRKTRYLQLDVSAYFQDVIPSKYIHKDYDIKNPFEPWRQQFRVKPNMRKMEFRMMDAPRTAYESAMQLRLVRALLSKAFNSNERIYGKAQKVSFKVFNKDPNAAFTMLQEMCEDLELQYDEYKYYVVEGLKKYQELSNKKNYKSVKSKMKKYPKIMEWDFAVPMRTQEEGPKFDKINWENKDGSKKVEIHDLSKSFKKSEQKKQARRESLRNNQLRKNTNEFTRHFAQLRWLENN